MATNEPTPKTFGEKLLSIPRGVLFLILIVCTMIPLFIDMKLPNTEAESTIDLYKEFLALPEGSTVIIQSDWTNSTRGESRGQFDALLRILMKRNIKFGIMSVADPQGPQVARDVVDMINVERKGFGQPAYKRWDDWVNLGFFPNAEGIGQALKANVRQAFNNKRDINAAGQQEDIFKSPVMSKITKLGDLSAFIVVTGTKSIVIALERISQDVKMLGMVTGVMGPETLNYYSSGQLKGLSAGLKGVYDLENLMEKGSPKDNLQPLGYERTADKGTRYILTLHVAIFLLIIAVIIGNIGVFLSRKPGNGAA